ncbi:MAG: hypothetical protein IJM37_10670 [Lachnospiraceae bacterium]|nr:hypothetical protein [Lachnospiraceae bacterium]
MSVLTILEVSQKQAFIFKSKKLKDNVDNSCLIAWIMSPKFFEKTINDESIFSEKDNLVYSGGGHVVLEFEDKDKSYSFIKIITSEIYKKHTDILVFATSIEYKDTMTPGENLKELTKKLEDKKAKRKAAFHQGSFGVEKINSETLKPVMKQNDEKDDCFNNYMH